MYLLSLGGFILLSVPTANGATSNTTPFRVVDLRTEYLTEGQSILGWGKIPRLSWRIELVDDDSNTTRTRRRGVSQIAYQILLSRDELTLQCKTAKMSNHQGDTEDRETPVQKEETESPSSPFSMVYDCGLVASANSNLVTLGQCDGFDLQSDSIYYWSVHVTLDDGSQGFASSSFRTAILSTNEWQAKWITGGNLNTLFRSDFHSPQVERHATLFSSGIGYHEIFLNGQKVGSHKLNPGWTDYSKRVFYSTHDVSSLLHEGRNVVGASLGNGWWSCGPPPGSNMPECSDSPPELLLQLHVDGKVVLATSDDSWHVHSGPILYNSLYNGESYDSRVEESLAGWSSPGFDWSDWAPACLASSIANNATLTPQLFEPIRHIQAHDPTNITSLSSGVQIVDFGKNQAAVVHLKHFFCERGTNVTLRHAEVLTHPPYGPVDGSIYVENLRSAKATDVYTCKGDATNGESYVPTFTQHGFRYVEVTGLEYDLKMEDIEVIELHSDVRQTSSIHFPIPLLNDIQQLVLNGQKSNLMSVPTDCNQRDERRGWTGDAALIAEEAAHNFGMGAFFTSWLMQINDAQAPDGSVPDFVPPLGRKSPGAPNWQSAFPVVLWTLLSYYGDKDVVALHHEALIHFYDWFESHYKDHGITGFTGYGDWVPPPPHPKANSALTGAFAFLHDLQLGVTLFQASPHPDASAQAQRLSELLGALTSEYHHAFYNQTTAMYMSGLQTEQALPLVLGVAPENLIEPLFQKLILDIQTVNDGHTTCGILGIKFLMEVLSLHHHSDVALDLALQTTYPSWGYMIHNEYEPATTLWELWNSDSGNPGMNSRNHIMFGSVSSWFYKHVAGITPAQPGYAQVRIQPSVIGGSGGGHSKNLTFVNATVVTPFGDLRSHWNIPHVSSERLVYSHYLHVPPGVDEVVLVFPIHLLEAAMGWKESNMRASIWKDLTIHEGNELVWKAGSFLAQTNNGITNGFKSRLPNDDRGRRHAIEFHLQNGRYNFTCVISTSPKVGPQDLAEMTV